MPRVTPSLLTALAAGLVTLGSLHFTQRSRAREAARLASENARLRLQAVQRHQSQTLVPHPLATPAASAAPSRADTPSPPADYRNEGQSTPLATLQTFAWACDRGDSETVRELLCFEPAAHTKAVAFMSTLPADIRARWNLPEAMAAELLTHQGMQQPFPAAPILERATSETMPDGRVVLRLPGTAKDGTVYQKIGDRWHYVITEAAVDRYIARASQPRPAPP